MHACIDYKTLICNSAYKHQCFCQYSSVFHFVHVYVCFAFLLGTARALLYSSASLQQELQDIIISILSDPRMPAALRRSVAALLQPIAKNRTYFYMYIPTLEHIFSSCDIISSSHHHRSALSRFRLIHLHITLSCISFSVVLIF
jgi:hypothetical protein